MRTYILILLAVVFFSSCKLDRVAPVKVVDATPMDISTLAIAPMFNASSNDQIVKLSVSGTNLKYVYTEHVDLLADSAKFHDSWYVYFKEDLTATKLAGMDFTSFLQWGVTASNYIPDNLNQIVKTVRDTTINNKKVIAIHFSRDLNFSQSFETAAEASAKADSLAAGSDHITFTTKYLPEADGAPATTKTYNLKYVKN